MDDTTENAGGSNDAAAAPSIPGGYVQAPERALVLTASGLIAISGQDWLDGSGREADRIEGEARPSGARLARIGHPEPPQALALTIRPFAGDSAPLVRIGFSEDAAAGDLDARLAAELFLPQAPFARLRQDLAAGQATSLRLSATTNLWLREGDADDQPVFNLPPDRDGRAGQAHGRVRSLDWRGGDAGPRNTGPSEPPPAAAGGESHGDPPEDAIADQLRRINWSLKQVLIVLVFVMLVIALK